MFKKIVSTATTALVSISFLAAVSAAQASEIPGKTATNGININFGNGGINFGIDLVIPNGNGPNGNGPNGPNGNGPNGNGPNGPGPNGPNGNGPAPNGTALQGSDLEATGTVSVIAIDLPQ